MRGVALDGCFSSSLPNFDCRTSGARGRVDEVMQRSVFVIGFVAAVLFVSPSATAGGWWTSIRLDRTTVAVGQEMKVHASVMFRSVDAAEAARNGEAQSTFYVYLLRGFDYSIVRRAMREASPQNWWSLGSADLFNVGRVVIRARVSNLAAANASFRVPEVRPGKYTVMLCDAGCTHPLADVVPTVPNQLTVTAAGSTDTSSWIRAAWLVVGVILGALLGFLLGRRVRPAFPERVTVAWQPSDEELEELLTSRR
jgi:hypothetical protein